MKGCSTRCAKCKDRHHKLICPRTNDSANNGDGTTRKNEAPVVPVQTAEPGNAATIQTDETVNGFHTVGVTRADSNAVNQRHTILQTAHVLVEGQRGVTEATILFYSGSDIGPTFQVI